jgi:hypothetical protein
MQDRSLESTTRCHRRIDVQEIPIARKAVEQA